MYNNLKSQDLILEILNPIGRDDSESILTGANINKSLVRNKQRRKKKQKKKRKQKIKMKEEKGTNKNKKRTRRKKAKRRSKQEEIKEWLNPIGRDDSESIFTGANINKSLVRKRTKEKHKKKEKKTKKK